MIGHLFADVIGLVVLAVVGSIATLVVIHFRHEGLFWGARLPGVRLRKVKCTDCDGCGVVYLDERGHWGIIPRHLRTYDVNDPLFRPSLANTRTCESCRGRGVHLLPYIKRTPDDDPNRPDLDLKIG